MGEEELVDEIEDEIKEEEVKEPEKDPYVDLAVKAGFNPNYEGENKKTAEQFILDTLEINKSLRKGYETTTRKLEEAANKIGSLENGFVHFKKAFEATREAERKKAESIIRKLQSDRMAAIEDGDVNKVREIESDISANMAAAKKEPAQPEPVDNPVFDKWHEKNQWYGTDPELTQYADEQAVLPEFKGLSPQRLYDKIEKRTKQLFSEKFPESKPAQKPKVTPVDGGGTPPGGKRKFGFKDLTPAKQKEVSDIISTFPKGVMSKQEYVDSMVAEGYDFEKQE